VERADGYHWFRLDDDGTTFIALREEGEWYLPGASRSVDVEESATYLRPVERPPHN
jgi:hypothetical protein